MRDKQHLAHSILRMVGDNRERVAAACVVLDYTKTKPVSKSEVTIGKAEALLASLMEQDKAEE